MRLLGSDPKPELVQSHLERPSLQQAMKVIFQSELTRQAHSRGSLQLKAVKSYFLPANQSDHEATTTERDHDFGQRDFHQMAAYHPGFEGDRLQTGLHSLVAGSSRFLPTESHLHSGLGDFGEDISTFPSLLSKPMDYQTWLQKQRNFVTDVNTGPVTEDDIGSSTTPMTEDFPQISSIPSPSNHGRYRALVNVGPFNLQTWIDIYHSRFLTKPSRIADRPAYRDDIIAFKTSKD